MSEDSSSEDEDYADVVRPFHLVYHWAMTGSAEFIEPFSKKINYAAVKFKPDLQINVAPPAPYLMQARKSLKQRIGVVSQSCCHEDVGAFTGEVSASMLRDVKAAGVVCGHWERRRRCGEEPSVVALQVLRATQSRLVAYFCFGETMEERTENLSMAVITSQISPLFELPIDWRKVVLVYQPVWSFTDEAFVAKEVVFPTEGNANNEEEEEVNEEEEEETDANVNKARTNVELASATDSALDRTSSTFDDQKWAVFLVPKTIHINDFLGVVRLWLRDHASRRIAWTTPILYGGHVAAHNGPEFAKMKNIDGLFVTRKSLIRNDLSAASETKVDGKKSEFDEELDDFISIVTQCGEREDDNANRRAMFKVGQKRHSKSKAKQ